MKNNPLSLLLLGCFFVAACTSPRPANEESQTAQTAAPPTEVPDTPHVQVTPSSPDDTTSARLDKLKPSSATSVMGIDISKFQGDEVSWLNRRKDSLAFVICKATEGNTYTDPKFTRNWKDIPEKGLVRGAYHFYRTNDKPETQAAFFTKAIKDMKPHDLPPTVDFEEGSIVGNQSLEQIQKDLLVFLGEVEKIMGRKAMIYTDINTGNKYLDNPEFSKYALWIANYRKADAPHLPKTWKQSGWRIWQHTDRMKMEHNTNDCDLFNGDYKALKAFILNY